MTERNLSAAYTVLRASARRVDRLVESEIVRQGDGTAIIYIDQLELCGSRRVYVPALSELHALGLLDVTRHPKRFVCRLSDRWREMTAQDARIASVMAREHAHDAEPNHVERVSADTPAVTQCNR